MRVPWPYKKSSNLRATPLNRDAASKIAEEGFHAQLDVNVTVEVPLCARDSVDTVDDLVVIEGASEG